MSSLGNTGTGRDHGRFGGLVAAFSYPVRSDTGSRIPVFVLLTGGLILAM